MVKFKVWSNLYQINRRDIASRTSGDTNVEGSLGVMMSANIAETLSVGQSVHVGDQLYVQGAASMDADITVAGVMKTTCGDMGHEYTYTWTEMGIMMLEPFLM